MPSHAIGSRCWAIPEGYIPLSKTPNDDPRLMSHESACMLNTNDEDAQVTLTLYFKDREPAGPYRMVVPARRTLHLRFNDLSDPQPVPRDTDYAALIESNVPIVVQHTRLDSRQAALALISTMAYASEPIGGKA